MIRPAPKLNINVKKIMNNTFKTTYSDFPKTLNSMVSNAERLTTAAPIAIRIIIRKKIP